MASNCPTSQKAVSALLAVMTIMWLPYVLADWAFLESLGNDLGIFIGTLLFLLAAYELLETAGMVEYPN